MHLACHRAPKHWSHQTANHLSPNRSWGSDGSRAHAGSSPSLLQLHEKVGYHAVHTLRGIFDWATGYGSEMNERKWLLRMIYLESVAGVPGMVAGEAQ
jgi:hypothetical protein